MSPADDGGQTLTEYALILVLIAVGAAVAVPAVQASIGGLYTAAAAAFGG